MSLKSRERGQHLYTKVCLHFDLEDAILVSALRDVGKFEPAGDVEVEHHERRELLIYLLERLGDEAQPLVLLVRDLLGFTSIRDDMMAEAADLLSDRLFRDDLEAV